MRTATLLSPCALIILLASPALGLAQAQQQPPPPPPTQEKKQEKEGTKESEHETWPRIPETMNQEMQYRAALEVRQSERRKALEAAEEILTLARRLKASAVGLERINVRQTLEAIEKLAKRIRSFSGGGESEQTLDNWPSSIESGAARIMALAEELKQQLEALDHRVISVTIIDDSNAIIQLTNYLRERVRSDGP